MPETITAVAWTCLRDRRLLVTRTRGSDAFYLPGGKPEPGETPEATAVREVFEETGVRLRQQDLTWAGEVTAPAHGRGPGVRVRLIYYAAASDAEPAPAAEIAELGWFTSADAGRCAPAIRIVIDRLVAAGALD
ncbi:NUDIX hydrolase [Mangrovihabitans endophyticus]|uniref:Nudix hydrolase domain-containing protein n=1 Tax=Mangrovihabitans endophyticus TaxID=1751298 RepID=A0A8J3C558_9ACTN|nr:NUDIX domain-containing protein [Mangrovihabitans endophyticus]GGL20527.1 hypothetical protein GCM10012284_63920 [Mangrovihabitans endophyticus]